MESTGTDILEPFVAELPSGNELKEDEAENYQAANRGVLECHARSAELYADLIEISVAIGTLKYHNGWPVEVPEQEELVVGLHQQAVADKNIALFVDEVEQRIRQNIELSKLIQQKTIAGLEADGVEPAPSESDSHRLAICRDELRERNFAVLLVLAELGSYYERMAQLEFMGRFRSLDPDWEKYMQAETLAWVQENARRFERLQIPPELVEKIMKEEFIRKNRIKGKSLRGYHNISRQNGALAS